MRFHNKVAVTLLLGVFVTTAAPLNVQAQTKSGVVNSRDQILNPTNTQQQQTQQNSNQSSPPAGKGTPGPLPCNSKNNPKCDNESPSKPGDNPGEGKGN
jgi:hypothetical protein